MKLSFVKKFTAERIFLILVLIVIVRSFWSLLFYNFVTDDFFYLHISKFSGIWDFLSFFSFFHSDSSGYIFYRPLATQVYYGIIQKLFGFSPLYYHFLSLFLHLANTCLVFYFSSFFFPKSKFFPVISALFFGLNASQTMAVGWAANFQEVEATFFILLATIFLYKGIFKRENFMVFSSLVFFGFALMSKELAMVFPFVGAFLIMIFGRRGDFVKIVPFFAVLLIYSFFHFVKYPFRQSEAYTFIINTQAINTFRWHVWWALGFPEPFINYIGNNLKILPEVWVSFFKEAVISFSLFIFLNLLILSGVFLIIRDNFKKILDLKFLFFVIFYIVFLIPVLFLPQNKYAYHQSTALVGFSLAFTILLKKVIETKIRFSRFIVFATIAVFTALSIFSVDFTIRNNFLLLRAKIVDKVLKSFQREYPALAESSIVYIKNDPSYEYKIESWGASARQAYYALNGEYAFRVLYGDSVKVYYEGVLDLPKDVDSAKLVEFVADLKL